MWKAIHIQATWGRRCTKLVFITEKDDTGPLPSVRVDVPLGRKYLAIKELTAFQHVYDHHRNDAEWFLKVRSRSCIYAL
jgi:glycoprotein-N-acetylgalactosamine 3-beta-galactosyltransferase